MDEQAIKIIKKRLNQYLYLRFEIENQCERLVRMKSAEIFPPAPEGIGGTSDNSATDRMASAVVRRIEQEERIYKRIGEIQEELNSIDEAINDIPIPLEREVLRMRYTDGENNQHMGWQEIAMRIYGDNDDKHILAIYRLHGRALENLAERMGGKNI